MPKGVPVAAFGQKPNFAGYDRENWAPRSAENHKAICTVLLKASSKTSLRDLEAEHGVRYSCLIQLPHFDPIRFARSHAQFASWHCQACAFCLDQKRYLASR